MTLSADITDFHRRDLTFEGKTKPVLTLGASGPAIIVVHEIYGFSPTLARLCRWLSDAGFRVYAPILFGTPDASNKEVINPLCIARLCISREFNMLAANRSSPVTDWLKQLARQAHSECDGKGVGAIGLCLTGGFALSMAVEPVVRAPVMSEPSLPLLTPAALDISTSELDVVKKRAATGDFSVRGYRFEGDTFCRPERFATLRREVGDAFVATELPDACGNPEGRKAQGKPPHGVLTADLIDKDGEPTRRAVDELIAFFHQKL
jgi:dienelactone hydrolase